MCRVNDIEALIVDVIYYILYLTTEKERFYNKFSSKAAPG